ncbi:MAG: ferredoxin [Candidatus Omnitrophota bacterium]|nr:MAG: ferredoxin [Candidatus Omnitrophota bacterium]
MAVKVDKEKCNGCASCVDICPVKAIEIKNDKAVVSDECVECGVCVEQCPNKALSLPGG